MNKHDPNTGMDMTDDLLVSYEGAFEMEGIQRDHSELAAAKPVTVTRDQIAEFWDSREERSLIQWLESIGVRVTG